MSSAVVLNARDWHDHQQKGLGAKFGLALEQLVERIKAMPELYGEVEKGVRRGRLKEFPYVLYYRVLADQIEVLGVLHGRRHEHTWKDRV